VSVAAAQIACNISMAVALYAIAAVVQEPPDSPLIVNVPAVTDAFPTRLCSSEYCALPLPCRYCHSS
jgi:hypothetical protein